MATLAEAVDAAETDWLVSADIPDTVDYLTVESEVVQVTATFPAQYQARDGSTSDPRIRVVRAAGGTTAASHADGTTLTPLIPPSASGGGTPDPGTLVVTLTGAETVYGHFYRGDEDPMVDFSAEVAPGDIWVDPSTDPVPQQYQRNAANDAWVPISPVALNQVLANGNDAGGPAIVGLADPTDPQDAATKAYVDSAGAFRVSAVDPGAIGAGLIWVNIAADPTTWQRRNATDDGWDPPFLQIFADGKVAVTGDGTADLLLSNGLASVTVAADGTITIGEVLTINPDGTFALDGAQTIEATAAGLFLFLTTSDPVVAGALWNDTGTVKVSAG